MKIDARCKKVVKNICLDIELEDEDEIRIFSNILENSRYNMLILTDSGGEFGYSYKEELKLLDKLQEKLKE